MNYLFELGHQPHISIAELQAVLLSTSDFVNKDNKYLIVELDKEIKAEKLMNQLGGIIKIGEEIKQTGDNVKTIVSFLAKNNTGKIHFSVPDKKMGIAVKKELKSLGRSVRYVEPKNAATILHNNLIEKQGDFTIVDNKTFVTVALQPFEEMKKRDYSRPGSDEFSGMLPPKLSKIMINLAQITPKQTLLDPFCGSGTVLTEALNMGYKNIIGADISEKAVVDTEKNIEWLKDTNQLEGITYKLYHNDATQIHNQINPSSVDAIVAEPYMGTPLRGNEKVETLEKQTGELAELYIGAFKAFRKILKTGGIAIFIIPQFKQGEDWIKIDCVEDIKDIGFKLVPFEKDDSLLYHRPKQHLGRSIWRFRKK